MRLPLFIVVSVFSVACATVPRVPGERLYLSKCGACHQRPERGSFDASVWGEVLEGHQKRFPLTKEEKELLSEFLAGGTGR